MERIELYAALLKGSIDKLHAAVARLPDGRGRQLVVLIDFLLDRLRQRLDELTEQIPTVQGDPRLEDVLARKYERLWPPMGVLHEIVALYASGVGRTDLPVGYLHLIDQLMDVVLIDASDPLVRLDPTRMYSTIDLATQLKNYFAAQNEHFDFDQPHPIAFYLPELDPENALYSAILAHEVTHSAINQGLRDQMVPRVLIDTVGKTMAKHLEAVPAPDRVPIRTIWRDQLLNWSEELLCDVVGVAVTGPAFAFAFIPFVPPSSVPVFSPTHPAGPLRWKMFLTALDQLGWTDFLNTHAPTILASITAEANRPIPAVQAREKFLLEAAELVLPNLIQLGIGHVLSPMPVPDVDSFNHAVDLMTRGIPAVEIDGEPFDTWTIVVAAWVVVFQSHGDKLSSLAEGVADANFNRLILKSIELAAVVDWWKRT